MGDIIMLTKEPVRVTATGYQPLYEALDVSQYDVLDLLLGVVGYTGAGSVTVRIDIGMQKQTDDGWVPHPNPQFGAFTAANTFSKVRFDQLLKYIRWNVSAFTATTATFFIAGVSRITGTSPGLRIDPGLRSVITSFPGIRRCFARCGFEPNAFNTDAHDRWEKCMAQCIAAEGL